MAGKQAKSLPGSFTMVTLPGEALRKEGSSFVSGADQNEINYHASWQTRSFDYDEHKPASDSEGETHEGSSSELVAQRPFVMESQTLAKDQVFPQQPPGNLNFPTSPQLAAQQVDMQKWAPDYSSMAMMQVPDGQYYVPMNHAMMMMPMMQQAAMMGGQVMVMPQQGYASDAVANTLPVPRSKTKATQNTTVMWRNIPNNYSRDNLLALVDSHGFVGSYDFFYSPLDFSSGALVGYAFINFVNTAEADRFFCNFQGFTDWTLKSEKKSQVTWSQPLQGLQGHIERYRNSAVMHPDVSDDKKPVLFSQGQRVAFPMPTKTIRAPHLKECRPRGQ